MALPDYVEEREDQTPDLTEDERKVYDGKTMAQVAQEVRNYWSAKKALEDDAKANNAKFSQLSKYLAERMESAQMTSFKVADLGTVYIAHDNKPYVTDRDLFFKYLRENGAEAMIKETVHPRTLLGWVNEQLEDNKELPDGVHNFILKRAKIRKS